MGRARGGEGPSLTSRALIVMMIVVAAVAGLPFSPSVRTASAAGGSPGSPAVPSVDFVYAALADDPVRVTATWRLTAAGGRVEVYSPGPSPPAGLAEVARLVREYGLFGRDRLVLLATPGDDSGQADLAAKFWGAALDWELGEDQEGWLRGMALMSLAATSPQPEAYLRELAADLTVAAAEPAAAATAASARRGEALVLAVNQA
ncbi:MAG: hypothetical protein ACYC41_12590, partial [Bacillota bacterium]